MDNTIYRLKDGRLWDVRMACWLVSDLAAQAISADDRPDCGADMAAAADGHAGITGGLMEGSGDAAIAGGAALSPQARIIDLVSASGGSDEYYLAKTLAYYGFPLGELLTYSGQGIREELARLDAEYLSPRTLGGLAIGDAEALARWRTHEEKAAPLRERLAKLSGGSE